MRQQVRQSEEHSRSSENDFSDMIDELKRRKRKLRKNPKKYLRKNSNQLSAENITQKPKTVDRIVINSSTYRKVPCQFYRVGNCSLGANCTFSHDIEQGNPDKLCKFYLVNACQKNPCFFSHDTTKFPCKYLFVSGKCNSMAGCKFSHQKLRNVNELKTFVEENIESIRSHLKDGIMTPITRYALEKGLIYTPTDAIETKNQPNNRQQAGGDQLTSLAFQQPGSMMSIQSQMPILFGEDKNFMQQIQSAFEAEKEVDKIEEQATTTAVVKMNESYFDPFS